MKIKGRFINLIPVTPYGYFRLLCIEVDGKERNLKVGFKKAYIETKQLKEGDLVELTYNNYDNFTLRKI